MLASPETEYEREFFFTDQDFEVVRKTLYRHAGIFLNDGKRDLVYGRLSRRLRELGYSDFSTYLKYLESPQGESETVRFINALTTNLTAFFREPHHFDFLAETLLPEAMRRHSSDRRIRIWSAGCSTGEEAYSIAMVVRELIPADQSWDVKILATDLDSEVLAKAKYGHYAVNRVAGISQPRAGRWFQPAGKRAARETQVNPSLQALITFKQLNLMHEWPMSGPFDLIFCRNVIIYFDKPTQRKLIERYADILTDGGYLFIGHSESLHNVCNRFELVGQTMYRKLG